MLARLQTSRDLSQPSAPDDTGPGAREGLVASSDQRPGPRRGPLAGTPGLEAVVGEAPVGGEMWPGRGGAAGGEGVVGEAPVGGERWRCRAGTMGGARPRVAHAGALPGTDRRGRERDG